MSFCGPPRDGTLTRLLGVFLRTTRWIQFLQHCQAKIQAAIRTLVQFLNESDSLSLLQEMTSSKATERLAVIKVNLDELKSLESRLHNMNVALKDLSKMVSILTETQSDLLKLSTVRISARA